MNGSLQHMLDTLPQVGVVRWMGIRPARGEPMHALATIELTTEQGITGDRYVGRSGKRQVTLIQWEHLNVIASVLGVTEVTPALLRRNIAVSGINLLALKGKRFTLGEAVLEYTGLCHPCSQMEQRFGPGGYNAVRGHGGITARVVEPGTVRLADQISAHP